MILLLTVTLPFVLLCLLLPTSRLRRVSLVAGCAAHFAVVMGSWIYPVLAVANPGTLLALDPLGHLFVTLISLLFLATSIFFVGYHQKVLVSQRVFLACMLLLLASLTLVCAAQHLGVLWVALEAASLAATPLIYFRLGPRALEATWKFLLMNSVGIALGLLGIFCLGLSTTAPAPAATTLSATTAEVAETAPHGEEGIGMTVTALREAAPRLDIAWVRAAFLLVLVGFGTKMGLAPLHSWKPDAYAEAPPPIAALFAGGVTLGAFLGILRVFQVCLAVGQGPFASLWMTAFGLLSILVAGIFIIGNNDYRRILAYTSVEHMGILVLAVGLAGLGGTQSSVLGAQSSPAYAAMLHTLHNTLNKGVLFFAVGFIWRIYKSNRISDVKGALHHHPIAGVIFLGGLCATTALPPFGMFYSEFAIILAAVQTHQWFILIGFIVTITICFVGVMTAMLPMAFGAPSVLPVTEGSDGASSSSFGHWREPTMLLPAAGMLILALALSLYQPDYVTRALHAAADQLTPVPVQTAEIPAGVTTAPDRPSTAPAGDHLEEGHL